MASLVRLGLHRVASAGTRYITAAQRVPRLLPHCAGYSSQHSNIADDRKYSDKHEWIKLDGNIGTIGISDYAQELLGDVVYVSVPDVDAEFDKGDEFGAVESVKAASELYTPVSGIVIEVNTALEDKPGLINSSPYDDGWILKLKLTSPEEYNDLLDAKQYADYLKENEE